jgi:hypothetical protein
MIRFVALWFVAVLLALLSVFVEQTGPELEQYGNLCGTSHDDPCMRPVLKGGFPLPFLFDVSGVSVENQLAFGEDRIVPSAFMVDCGVYAIAIWLSFHAAKRLRRLIAQRAN